jgi:hypothetical protein
LEAALQMQELFPHINFKREVTIGHLILDTDAPVGALAKVNPPIREREDVEYLWEQVSIRLSIYEQHDYYAVLSIYEQHYLYRTTMLHYYSAALLLCCTTTVLQLY